MTVPTSWSSAALSTFSPIANFDIENSFWSRNKKLAGRKSFDDLMESPNGDDQAAIHQRV
jgi:hypothetical protein